MDELLVPGHKSSIVIRRSHILAPSCKDLLCVGVPEDVAHILGLVALVGRPELQSKMEPVEVGIILAHLYLAHQEFVLELLFLLFLNFLQMLASFVKFVTSFSLLVSPLIFFHLCLFNLILI